MMEKQIQSKLTVSLVLAAALVLAGCSAGSAIGAAAPAPAATPVPTIPIPTPGADLGFLASLDHSLESIYRAVDPSVVNIRVVKEVSLQSLPQFPFSPLPLPQEPQRQQGSGSGFVWDNQGRIVTNNHVIDGASEIQVTFSDGQTFPGKVIGTDPDSDLAVVKVGLPAKELQPVALATSADVKVGQLAIALGNPFGLQGSMTVGIVSALGRTLPTSTGTAGGPRYTIPAVIQTDAPINPGNSGGVLVNDQGQVIGVTSAIISPVRASAGIGFAIPSDIVAKVVPDLIKQGHHDHTYLGVSGVSLNPNLAQAMELDPTQQGALIVSVTTGGPADKAGLRGSAKSTTINGQEMPIGGDVIVAVDGTPVRSFDDLSAYIALDAEVGQRIELTVLRDGEAQSVAVTLQKRPKTSSEASN